MKTRWIFSVALLSAWFGSASLAQAPDASAPGPVYFIPTYRLFTVPTADVLRSLDISLSGGGAFSAESERSFLGRAAVGLGDVAEVEISTVSVLTALKSSSSSVPTSAFKMRVFSERGRRPALAWVLRGTTAWRDIDTYRTRLTRLQVVASKSVGTVDVHAGVGWADIRVKDPGGYEGGPRWRGEMKRNLFSPFGGFSVPVNPRTTVMGEVDMVPRYDFGEGLTRANEMILYAWSGAMGVRFYFARWLSTDAGVIYRSDFDGLADATIRASANVLLPFSESKMHWKWD
jgi:hypothetical protein